jgi:hypothetical protein
MSEDFYIVPTGAIWEPGVEYGADGCPLPHVSVLLATTGRTWPSDACKVSGTRLTGTAWRSSPPWTDPGRTLPGSRRFGAKLTTPRPSGAARLLGTLRYAFSRGEHVVLAADDLTWGEGWLDAALAKMAEFPDGWGLVGFNDGHWGEDLSTHYLVSRRLIIEHLGGRIAWEHYVHSFNDVEINERARRAGRYAWCEAAYVTHEHWLFGDRAQDDTDLRNLPAHPASERVFHDRRAAGFPDDLEPVIT